MTIATWVLAGATLLLALEGGTALLQWMSALRAGRTRRELGQLREQVTLLQHAVWLDVSRGGQGSTENGDQQVRNMLTMSGFTPDPDLMEKAGHFDLHRIMGHGPSLPGT